MLGILYRAERGGKGFCTSKGASAEDVELLEQRMEKVAKQILAETGVDVSGIPGAGAAGGLGGAFIAYAGAKIVPGVEKVMSLVGFDDALDGADLVITGEGKSDLQTLEGKVPFGVLRHSAGCRVALVSGAVEHGAIACLEKAGFAILVRLPHRKWLWMRHLSRIEQWLILRMLCAGFWIASNSVGE